MIVAVTLLGNLGCEPSRPRGEWHRKHHWQADFYFRGQPRVIDLCYAIEANDLEEIDRLIAAGADVNAIGRANMTPLMWAYPDDRLDRFVRLLEHGADPNVAFQSDLNTQGELQKGGSVTFLATMNPDLSYLEAVLKYGGDPDFSCKWGRICSYPLVTHLVLKQPSDIEARLRVLVASDANLNFRDSAGLTPPMAAVGWFGRYELALLMFELGADPFAYQENYRRQLSHVLVREANASGRLLPNQRRNRQRLLTWLEQAGVDFDAARADEQRWEDLVKQKGRKVAARLMRKEGDLNREREAQRRKTARDKDRLRNSRD